jgi:hypothetical protein
VAVFYSRFAGRALAGSGWWLQGLAMRPSPFFASALLLVIAPLPVTAQYAPSAKPAKPTQAAETKEEKTIPGVVLTRPDGRFLGVETEGVVMKVTFYTQDKEPEAADAIRITARWTDTQPRRTVLLPSSAETLASPGVMRRPFNYIVYLALVGADEQVMESHSLRLQ